MKTIDLIHHIEEQLQPELKQKLICNQYAWWLLEKLTSKQKNDLILNQKIDLSDAQLQTLHLWIDQICKDHKPISYILGEVPFGPLSIIVKPPVLIPRMETEQWTLTLIEQIKQAGIKNLSILDLCSGSGCIALLCAHMLPTAKVYAADICSDAIALAKENITQLKLKNIQIYQSDLMQHMPQEVRFDLILCNPPYITAQEYAELEPSVTQWEHKHALTAPDDGLALIKKIITQAPFFLKENKQLATAGINQLYIEIGWQQGPAVKKLMNQADWHNVTIDKDQAKKDRVVSGSKSYVATTPS